MLYAVIRAESSYGARYGLTLQSWHCIDSHVFYVVSVEEKILRAHGAMEGFGGAALDIRHRLEG
jgi:hypothetical protein